MSLGKRIREARKAKNLSQLQLAETCGTFQKLISDYEKDKAVPYADVLKKIADALGVTADHLLGSESVQLNNPEFVELLNQVDKLPKKEKEALLVTMQTFLNAYRKSKN